MMYSIKRTQLYAYHSNVVNTQLHRSSYCHVSNILWITISETASLWVIHHVMSFFLVYLSTSESPKYIHSSSLSPPLTARTEPCTLWCRIAHYPPHCLRTSFTLWWRIRIIRTTCVLHYSQGLQLCWSCRHIAWRCVCLSLAECHIVPLRYRYISDAALSPYISSFEILSHITIQSSLQIHCLQLDLLRQYRIFQVWNILSNLHTL